MGVKGELVNMQLLPSRPNDYTAIGLQKHIVGELDNVPRLLKPMLSRSLLRSHMEKLVDFH